jgi:plasmid stabilization system protein ParE
MILRLVIEPEAEADIARAADWYEERAPLLRVQFLRAIDSAVESIQGNPHQYQLVYGKARRAMLERFPYALIYVASEHELIVAACFHCSRDPKRWQSRTG